MNYGYTKISGFRVHVHMSLSQSVLQLSHLHYQPTDKRLVTWDRRTKPALLALASQSYGCITAVHYMRSRTVTKILQNFQRLTTM